METFKEYIESLETKPDFDFSSISEEIEGMRKLYEEMETKLYDTESSLAKKDDEIQKLKDENFEIRKDLKDDDYEEEKMSKENDEEKEKSDIVGKMLGIEQKEVKDDE